jgi:hypothetical protein
MRVLLLGATLALSLNVLMVWGQQGIPVAEATAVTEAMRERAMVSQGDPARLYSVLAKARRGEPICVAAIGGSITAGGRLEYDVSGTVLLLGRNIPAVAKERVELVIDGGAPRPLLHDGHNLPVEKGLPSGLHRVAIVVQPFEGTEKDKVQIGWGGAAGL